MPAGPHQRYLSSEFDHCWINGTGSVLTPDILPKPDLDISPNSSGELSHSISDMFGLSTPRSTSLVSQSQLTPILNSGDRNSPKIENNYPDYSMMNIADKMHNMKLIEISGLSPKADYTKSSKLTLDLSGIQHLSLPSRMNGSSPFSDSSVSTGSSSLETSFFPNPCRSDSPNSDASSCSTENLSINTNTTIKTVEEMSSQELSNLHNLHVVNCMLNMPKDQINNLVQILQTSKNSPSIIPQITKQDYTSVPNLHLYGCMSNIPTESEILEIKARHHRAAAVSGNVEAQYTWSGKLPKRSAKGGPYSPKVFLGGVPWEINQDMLECSFRQFGKVKVEWPGGKEHENAQPKGYAYMIFESGMQVKLLLESCRESIDDDDEVSYYYKIPSRKSKPKEIQVIPWSLSDCNYSGKTYQKLESCKTVFVGALHGMMNAEGLFKVMNDLFEGVLYAGIDTDINKYPMGSARVAFNNHKSYAKAVSAAFVDIKTTKFNKKVQIDPYLEDSPCNSCKIKIGPYFCRENRCYCYFCLECWISHHSKMPFQLTHKALMRNSKHGTKTTNAVQIRAL